MAEAHLDHPGETHWFTGYGPAAVLGPCPHTTCKHLGQGVIGWGPSMDRYELVACGSIRPADESDSDCAMHCRAWVDAQGRVVTEWLNVDLAPAAARPVHTEETPADAACAERGIGDHDCTEHQTEETPDAR